MRPGAPPLFTHEVTLARAQAEEVIEGMLHTVLFFRLLGTLEPSTVELYGVELPHVLDAAIQKRVAESTAEILARTDEEVKHEGTALVDILVSWHEPAETPRSPSAPPTAQNRKPSSYPIFHSPYSWLASALAGGKSDARGGQARRVLTRDEALETLPEAFEQWLLSVRIVYEAAQRSLKPELSPFLCMCQADTVAALTFANEHQAQLPAVTDASLMPFPFSIGSTLRE
ncbi:hypothetical protein MBRA1_002498 [Malassezia brasiliensis]|uniref:Autophagy-related protein 101 n=1 Tax=Malassezia brasiliensis TaxID=1821822 RepID=A0AAF0DXK6_9BASI|nr:hypothetical protein MBRA1_002498 [Malassezia brasiliensis]